MDIWEIEEFEKSHRELVVFLRRRRNIRQEVRSVQFMKDYHNYKSLSLIHSVYDKGDFGVISIYQDNRSIIDNFEEQFSLVEELLQEKQNSIAHLGFWDELPQHCLFIPRITQIQIRLLAFTYETEAYVWGNSIEWKCYRTEDDTILASGNSPMIIEADWEFYIFKKIMLAEKNMHVLLNRYKKYGKRNKAIRFQRSVLKRQLEDLNRIKMDILNSRVIKCY